MSGNRFVRTGVVLLTIGIGYGVYLGITHDFTFAPVHAHLNLVGGVLMILAGLFYTSRPDLSRLAGIHYWINLAGALVLPVGIYGSIAQTAWAGPVVGVGSLLVMAAMLFFVFTAFRTPPKTT